MTIALNVYIYLNFIGIRQKLILFHHVVMYTHALETSESHKCQITYNLLEFFICKVLQFY